MVLSHVTAVQRVLTTAWPRRVKRTLTTVVIIRFDRQSADRLNED